MTLSLAILLLVARPDTSILVNDAIRYLTGASDLEVVSPEDAQRLEALLRAPLKINSCNRGQLVSSGLFSSYQVETLLDYRQRCGPLLSSGELAMVDGFDERLAGYLSCFVDFDPSLAREKKFEGEVSAFAAGKIASGKGSAQWMGRARASYGAFSASFAGKSQWSWPVSLPKDFGCSFSYSAASGCLSSAIAGYFNARFGQGLCMWSGMVMENYSTPSALMKRPSGLAPYTSSSVEYAMRGAALSFHAGSFTINALYDCSSHNAGANVSWNHSSGQVGVTARASPLPQSWKDGWQYSDQWCISADFQQIIGCVTLYGETTILQNLLGVRLLLGNFDAGLRLFHSREEHSVSLAVSWLSKNRRHSLDFGSTLMGYPVGKDNTPRGGMQLKTLTTYTFNINDNWSTATRLSARMRNWIEPYRFDLRGDLRFSGGAWKASARVNGLYCKSFSGLCYIEGAYKSLFLGSRDDGKGRTVNRLEVWLQGGVFLIDNWEDRIYVYQKDAPQSFNVPAMYGRGWWLSLFSTVRLFNCFDIYLRAAWEDYPWARATDTRKRPSLSLKLQLVVSL